MGYVSKFALHIGHMATNKFNFHLLVFRLYKERPILGDNPKPHFLAFT